jgi:hypothetical protein
VCQNHTIQPKDFTYFMRPFRYYRAAANDFQQVDTKLWSVLVLGWFELAMLSWLKNIALRRT